MLDVLVLGEIRAVRGVTELHPGGPKQRLILAHLAMAGSVPVSPDQLAEDLWSTAPADPAHAIQAHVSRLRSGLSVDVEHVAGGYRITPGTVRVDAWEFERLHAEGVALLEAGSPVEALDPLRRAIDLWHAQPFGSLGGALGLQPHAARLERLRIEAASDLVEARLRTGDVAGLVPHLYERVESEPLVERQWEHLMWALQESGHRSESMEVFHRAREILVDQLGIEPGPRLQELYRAALGATSTAPRVPPVRREPAASEIVGRVSEWSMLQEAWYESRERLRVVTVTGDAGIGKTRLVADFVAQIPDARLLWARCHDSIDIAYQPIVELLRADLSRCAGEEIGDRLGPGAAALGGLIPDIVAALPDGATPPFRSSPEAERLRIFDAIVEWFTRAAAQGPLCLVIDDVHWADAESPHVLHHLLSVAAHVPALLIFTYRDREHGASATSRLGELVRQSETVTHLPLVGLAAPAVGELLAHELDGHDARPADGQQRASDELVAHIAEVTGGNPLFVLELARQLQPLENPSVAALPRELPAGMRAVIGSRLHLVADDMRELLEVAAVVGQQFDPLLVSQVSGVDHDAVDEFLKAARYARIVEGTPDSPLRHQFTHAVVRTAVYDDIARIRRARLHLAVAEAMEGAEQHPATGHLHELAHHHVEAAVLGSPDRAIAALLQAGDASAAQRAPSAALELYERAWAMLPEGASTELRCDLLLRRGTVGFEAGVEYREHLLAAAMLARESGDEARLTAAAVANNRGWYSNTTEVDHQRVLIIEAALDLCPETKVTSRARLLSTWAMENVRDPQSRGLALSRSRTSYELAMAAGDPELFGEVMCHRYSVLYATFDDPYGCVDLSVQLYEFAHTRTDPELQLNAAIALAQATTMTGDFVSADRALERSRFLAEELRHPARTWLVRSWQAARLLMKGDVEGGERTAADALDLGLKYGQPDAMTWFAGQLFALHHVTGRLPELVESIEEQAVTHADGIPCWRAAYAVSLTTVGRLEEAERILDEFVVTDFDLLPQDMLRLHGLCYLAEVATAVDRVDAAKVLYEHLLPHDGLVANNATIDAGPVSMYLGMLARVAGDRQLAWRHLSAAQGFCERAPAPLWGARSVQLAKGL